MDELNFHSDKAQHFPVTVDLEHAEVIGFEPLSEALVDFINEDLVTWDDGVARLFVEALAHYLTFGEIPQALAEGIKQEFEGYPFPSL